jgi:hypothetical protein
MSIAVPRRRNNFWITLGCGHSIRVIRETEAPGTSVYCRACRSHASVNVILRRQA